MQCGHRLAAVEQKAAHCKVFAIHETGSLVDSALIALCILHHAGSDCSSSGHS